MTHRPVLSDLLENLDILTDPHRAGHRCLDGNWWNSQAGARKHCPTYNRIQLVREQATTIRDAVHAAAHDDDAPTAVAEGMTGLVMVDLDDESREGWTLTARLAIETLAAWLDVDHVLEARRTATLARLEAAGLPRTTEAP